MMREWVATGRWAAGLRGWTGAVMLALLALLPFSPAQAAGKKHTSTATSHRTAAKAHSAKATAPRKSESKASSSRSPRVSAKLDGRRHGKARVASKTHRLSLRPTVAREEPPARLSFGQMAGLHEVTGPLGLKSSVALVVDQDTHQVLLGKNEHAVLPIASLTKLMTGMVVSEARLPMDQVITITDEDVDTEKNSRSRLTVGTELSRGELLHLALMSSENRAAHALGRTFPGGLNHFVSLMNARAQQLGMTDTRYVEPTGLSSANQSSARDLAVLVNAAYQNPQLRELTTSPSHEVAVGHRLLQFNNTNGLVKSPEWDIGLQKTGFINEAGRCLVMQTRIAGRKLIMVFLDSAGKYTRFADAERVRRWVEMLPHSSTVASHGFAG